MPKEKNDRYAEAAWASKEEDVKSSHKQTMQFRIAALKGPVLINSAAVAALLGFVSANAKKLSGSEAVVVQCLWIFSIALLVSSLSSAAAYITQYLYTLADNQYEKSTKHPYIFEKESRYKNCALVAHVITALLVVCGYLLFFLGVFKFQKLIAAVL